MASQGALVPEGRGVCVVAAAGRDAGGAVFELQEQALAPLLARAGDRPVALVSIAGVYRGGKSFLLNFLLRYLYAEESARVNGSWLEAAESAPLRGFAWRGGRARETTDLVLWSVPFLVTLPTGEEVAVLLLDTQGAFDELSSPRDSAQVFALSTLLASVQVYNVFRNIDETHLQHLQVFTEYAAQGGGALPALQLLVRDWRAPYEFPYGAGGGADYLRVMLQEREEQPRELRSVRRRLAASFGRVRCFLLPHPGLRADTDPAFAGQLKDLTEEFKQSLRSLVPLLLAPENLLVKTVEGRPLRAPELAPLLRAYLAAFRSRVPEPRDLLTATAVMSWQSAAATARAAVAGALPRATLPRPALRARLDAVRNDALAPLRPLAERAGDLDGLADLEREIVEQLTRYVEINGERIAAAVAGAELQWQQAAAAAALLVQAPLCRHAARLQRAADAARAAALAHYDARVTAAGEDPDHTRIVAWIQNRYDEVIDLNNTNSYRAVEVAYDVFSANMRTDYTFQQGDDAVDRQLSAAEDLAVEEFRKRRPSLTEFGVNDVYYDKLIEKMRFMHDYYQSKDKNKATKTAVAGVAAQIGCLAVATVATGPVGAVASAGAIVALAGNIAGAYYSR